MVLEKSGLCINLENEPYSRLRVLEVTYFKELKKVLIFEFKME